jgi:polar amino acid transport system permease protein
MGEFSLWVIVSNLLLAARWTVGLAFIAFVGGGLTGLVILFMRVSPLTFLRVLAIGYIEVLQGTPLLMQLFLAFFGLSLIGIELPPLAAAGIALTLYTGAYLAEIWRGSVESIHYGQWEASACLALTRLQQMRHVILPQAVRIAIPPTVGFLVQVVKGTALASIIGFVELTKAGTMITNATFRPFLVYALVALMYFLLCYPLSLYSQHLERKLHVAR